MPILKEQDMRKYARQTTLKKSAEEMILESVATESRRSEASYDVFLSHSSKDAELILGVKLFLERYNQRVYIDWIDDQQLDRESVNPETAELLKHRMKTSKTLLYVTTENSQSSKWMPWECGYFDGLKEKVAILPLSTQTKYKYNGQEYLGLYPYCIEANDTNKKPTLWIQKDANSYTSFETWKNHSNDVINWRT